MQSSCIPLSETLTARRPTKSHNVVAAFLEVMHTTPRHLASPVSHPLHALSSARERDANRRFEAVAAMPTEWKARLDGRGYHATSVKRVSMAARWDADGAPRAPQKTALLRATPSSRNPDDPDDQSKQLLVAKGDAFYPSGARRGQPAEAHPRSRRSIPSWPPALTSTTPRSRHSPTRGDQARGDSCQDHGGDGPINACSVAQKGQGGRNDDVSFL